MLEDARNDNKDTDTEHLRRKCERQGLPTFRSIFKDLTDYRILLDMITIDYMFEMPLSVRHCSMFPPYKMLAEYDASKAS